MCFCMAQGEGNGVLEMGCGVAIAASARKVGTSCNGGGTMSRWYVQQPVDYKPYEGGVETWYSQPAVTIRLSAIESFTPIRDGMLCRMSSGYQLFIAGEHAHVADLILRAEP